MRIVNFGEAPEPVTRRRTIEQDPPSTQTKSTTRRRSVLTNSSSTTASNHKSTTQDKGKGKAREIPLPRSGTSSSLISQGSNSAETDNCSLKENPGREEVTAMELVTSISAGSLGMDQAMQAVTAQQSKARRRKPIRKIPLHIEVALNPDSTSRAYRPEIIKKAVLAFIDENFESLLPESEIVDWDDVALLSQHVSSIKVAECGVVDTAIPLRHAQLHIHVYRPSQQYIVDSFSAAQDMGEDEDDDNADVTQEDSDVMAATVAQLPSLELEGIWENLIYEDNVKLRLLNYINSTQAFGDRNVNFNVITWNRVVLLHGPPGTGKTSLCRALAQKLAIRLSDRYIHGKLVEINSHSIMSKWFSESGKLVQRLFTKVMDLVDDENTFVVVLIDEVESLTSARAGAMSGKEPSDAVRVVNALLTQLDKLKNRKNVLVLTTSNLSSAIDSAFIDRADIKQYIGLPPVQAIYWILLGCLRELMRSGVMRESDLLDWKRLKLHQSGFDDINISKRTIANSENLQSLAESCHGMSGRTLRRLPLLAHARHMARSLDTCDFNWEDEDEEVDELESVTQSEYGFSELPEELHTLETWLDALIHAIKAEKEQLDRVEDSVDTA